MPIREARTGAEKCRSRAPRGAPARVMGRSSQAILRWVRSRDGPPGAALPHQRLSALCSPHVFRAEQKTDKGTRPSERAGGALAEWIEEEKSER